MLESHSMNQIREVILPADYLAAREGTAFYVIPEPGYVEVRGATRVDYLQRQTTNDLSRLRATSALPNLLTSASGRILEVFTLVARGDAIGLLTEPGHGPGLEAYFKKRIFFNDQVIVEDKSTDWTQIELHGPRVEPTLIDLGFSLSPKIDEVITAEAGRNEILAIGKEGLGKSSVLVLVPSQAHDQVVKRLLELSAVQLWRETRKLLRIEASKAGTPEFRGEFTPFEIGLERYVSAEKGCYTGQEVLARQVTYDKIVRRMVQLRMDEVISAGATIFGDGKSVGQATSAVVSPSLGPMALGVVRKPFDAAGTELEVKAEEGSIKVLVAK